MRLRIPPLTSPASRGFSMIELVVVIGLIILMAAVGLPNFIGYLRQAKVRGATNEVAGEIQIARNRAIKKNVNPSATGGVVFAILDQDSYRFTVLDDNRWPPPQDLSLGLAPVRNLPQGVVFERGVTNPIAGFAFDSMGRVCRLNAMPPQPPCTLLSAAAFMTTLCSDVPAPNVNCTNRPPTAPAATYIDEDATIPGNTTLRIRVREVSTGIVRTVSVNMGGKVQAQK